MWSVKSVIDAVLGNYLVKYLVSPLLRNLKIGVCCHRTANFVSNVKNIFVDQSYHTMVEAPPPARASWFLLVGSIFSFLAAILLVISFASPYWLESYTETYSEFVRMGLWDFCFKNYRHPPYQHDEVFNGCHWVFSYRYQNIRDWLQPAWLIFVQAVMTIAILFSLFSLTFTSIILMRFLLKLEVYIIGSAFIYETIITISMFLAVSVFGGMCYDRSWLLYPMYNHLSWSYGLAVVSMFFHAFAAVYLFMETSRAHEHRKRASNLVYNMQPRF